MTPLRLEHVPPMPVGHEMNEARWGRHPWVTGAYRPLSVDKCSLMGPSGPFSVGGRLPSSSHTVVLLGGTTHHQRYGHSSPARPTSGWRPTCWSPLNRRPYTKRLLRREAGHGRLTKITGTPFLRRQGLPLARPEDDRTCRSELRGAFGLLAIPSAIG